MNIRFNDNWIIQHLGGSLIPEIKLVKVDLYNENICVLFESGIKIDYYSLNHVCGYRTYYNPIKNEISYKDINEFYETRCDKNNLIKLKVERKSNPALIYPASKMPLLWVSNVPFPSCLQQYIEYVGPKTEKQVMIDKLIEFYDRNQDSRDITIGVIQDWDRMSGRV